MLATGPVLLPAQLAQPRVELDRLRRTDGDLAEVAMGGVEDGDNITRSRVSEKFKGGGWAVSRWSEAGNVCGIGGAISPL